MRLYLSRRANGTYQLTRKEPILMNIDKTDKLDAYVAPGDPVVFQNLCPWSTKFLTGIELDIGRVIQVDVKIEQI